MLNPSTRLILIAIAILLAACSTPAQPAERTGMPEIDHIIETALAGDVGELRSLVHFTQAHCTNAEGLGGPPKCLPDEAEGTLVEVLPLLGAEGSFIRKAELQQWEGVQAASLYAVYEVSAAAYSDENYPRGEYALVFISDNEQSYSITLQVTQGRIVRIDYGYSDPSQINESLVARYLVEPAK
ncbi:MAG: hypothetical protein KIT70_00910 [Anaerolineales bacterium]|nr:MAG: hypothetical protein KIT70_00910 [Anaerolineales bacterium]